MPQMGYDMEEGTVIRWLIEEGAEVALGDAVAEIETDKAAVDFESPVAGVLLKVLVAEGTTVPVGETIAIVGDAGEDPTVTDSAPEETEPAAAPDDSAADAPAAETAPQSAAEPQAEPQQERTAMFEDNLRASPVARKLAEEQGIDLSLIKGTGPGGRITRDDVLSFAPEPEEPEPEMEEEAPAEAAAEPVAEMEEEEAPAEEAAEPEAEMPEEEAPAEAAAEPVAEMAEEEAPAEAAAEPVAEMPEEEAPAEAAAEPVAEMPEEEAPAEVAAEPVAEIEEEAPAEEAAEPVAEMEEEEAPAEDAAEPEVEEEAPAEEEAEVAEEPAGEMVPLTRMRRQIARVTVRSKQETPHYYVSAEIDMTEAMSLRQQINSSLEAEGVRVTVNDLVIKACATALGLHPKFNASYSDDGIWMNDNIDIGIAIAQEAGLIVPAVMDCGGKSLRQISAASKDVISRANGGTLSAEEYTGGTFSISNMGMFDITSFVAIILPPQSAMLAVGSVTERAVVRGGKVTVASVMNTTLSADHRVSDGAEGARFILEIKRLLENPLSLVV